MTEKEKIELKRNWRLRWLGELFLMTHLEYQKDLWVNRKYPNEIGWFSENIYRYFDDLYLDDNYQCQIKDGIISQLEFESIQDFHFALEKFVEMTNKPEQKFNETEIFKNEYWLKICEIGKKSWTRLKQIISDENELIHMHRLERYYLTNKK
ncbi:hypothetical protein [Flammeovirga sp. SJP92]|uniref:hypothetical protein n=1 Tax=Flammeovirga sp. SJP92 TaxID=1775430 RepID=UPI0007872988|nr:hypothetical protein [Flammeovirga sp. SJP92]KXX66800.1 hypothetical protein AVL50_30165 [Flammeovirga sp. SJP92]